MIYSVINLQSWYFMIYSIINLHSWYFMVYSVINLHYWYFMVYEFADCSNEEEYDVCVTLCPDTCDNWWSNNNKGCPCKPGCRCKKGLVRHVVTKKCIDKTKCPNRKCIFISSYVSSTEENIYNFNHSAQDMLFTIRFSYL